MLERKLETFIEIYATYDILEAEQIIGILQERGILARTRDLGISPYPLNIGNFNEKRIMVMASDKTKALSEISNAIEDQIISSSGLFMDKRTS